MANKNKSKMDKQENKKETAKLVEKKFKLSNLEMVVTVIGVLLLAVVIFNAVRISNLSGGGSATENVISSVSASKIIPKGVPAVYGKELGISYDDISTSNSQTTESTIGILTNIDNSVTLTGADLTRYVKIGSMIACEYCCGAQTLVFSNGQPACGCAHSYAMRGLAKYLIKNHGTDYTDDAILEELGKWKVLFFPGVHETKAAVLKSKGIEINYINLASNKYRGIEKGQSSDGAMVGGC